MAFVVLLVAVALAGCAQQTAQDGTDGDADLQTRIDQLEQQVQQLQQDNRDLREQVEDLRSQLAPETGTDVRVVQESGKTVYWVLPGPRRLSTQVFGTPEDRRNTGQWQTEAAPPPVKPLLEAIPFVVGVPENANVTVENGTMTLQTPTLFSDNARIVTGSMDVTYKDRQPRDTMPPGNTSDTADLSTNFTDPAGNSYRIEIDHVVQPPIPGYATAGGVLVNGYHHGITATGSPLMPRVYTYGAFWAVVDVYVNGELASEHQVGHFMTTQVVRNADYELAIDEELPLPPSDRPIVGQTHHTHGVVFPFAATPDGPRPRPVNTSFTLPNGQDQPFIHVMFEQDRVVEGPFTDPAPAGGDGGDGIGSGDADYTITAHDDAMPWEFTPTSFNVTAGEEVTVEFVNEGDNGHNWGVDLDQDGELQDAERTATIGKDRTTTITFTAPSQPGDYAFWCDISGHREAGLEGTMTVQAA